MKDGKDLIVNGHAKNKEYPVDKNTIKLPFALLEVILFLTTLGALFVAFEN